MLFPIDWPEPFGLVMIEAMACGTPVIAFRRGSVPELVEEGVTGFVVDTIEEAVTAAGRIARLDRAKVRAQFERRFTAERMARGYLEIYQKLLSARETYAHFDPFSGMRKAWRPVQPSQLTPDSINDKYALQTINNSPPKQGGRASGPSV